jgi:N-methylhydantoinase A
VHAATLAEDLRIGSIIVPPIAGVFSALGLLFADIEHQLIRGHYRLVESMDHGELTALLSSLIAEGAALLAEEGYPPERQDFRIITEVKYLGQMSTLPITIAALPVTDDVVKTLADEFARQHEQTYGYSSEREKLQIVAVKVLARGVPSSPRVPDRIVPDRELRRGEASRLAYFGPDNGSFDTPVLSRSGLTTSPRPGPLIIEEYDSTTVVRPGWTARLDAANNMILERAP